MWKSVYTITQVANVYDKDQRHIYVQEIYGESLAPSNRLFGEKAYDALFTLDNRIVLNPNLKKNFIYVGKAKHTFTYRLHYPPKQRWLCRD